MVSKVLLGDLNLQIFKIVGWEIFSGSGLGRVKIRILHLENPGFGDVPVSQFVGTSRTRTHTFCGKTSKDARFEPRWPFCGVKCIDSKGFGHLKSLFPPFRHRTTLKICRYNIFNLFGERENQGNKSTITADF